MVWDAWANTKTAYVVNPPSVANFEVKVIVEYLEGMRADFADLRFSKDGSELSHAIWSYVASTEAEVWVKIPADATSFTMHYGKADATDASDRDATFLFCDIFDGYFSDHWVHVYRGEVSSSAVMSAIDELWIQPPSNMAPASMRGIISNTTFAKGLILEYRDKMVTNGYYPIVSFGRGTMQDAAGGSSLWHHGAFEEGFVVSGDDMTAAGGVGIWVTESGKPATTLDTGDTAYSALTTLEDKRVEWRTDNSIHFYRGTTEIASGSMGAMYPSVTDFKLLFAQGWYDGTGGTRCAQWIRVRHYASTEPTVTFTPPVAELEGSVVGLTWSSAGTLKMAQSLEGTVAFGFSVGSPLLRRSVACSGSATFGVTTAGDLTLDALLHPAPMTFGFATAGTLGVGGVFAHRIFGVTGIDEINRVPVNTIAFINTLPS